MTRYILSLPFLGLGLLCYGIMLLSYKGNKLFFWIAKLIFPGFNNAK